jgi:class 3 adenylate cyclase
MQCPNCKFDNADGMNFCGKCGYQLSPSLKTAAKGLSFDEKLEKIQKYLPKGLTEKILSQRDKIEGERKHVTVMFCDMAGFTRLSEILGPEEAYLVMDQVYEILIHIVQDHEGTVNEFTGDGVMALFGVPITLEDAPQRAIRSAYTIHRKMTNFSDKLKQEKENMPSLKMRIGIHTGPVVVGALGNDLRVEFKAVGDTVNLASRMEGLAEPGATYVTENTFKLTKGLFQFEALGEKEVKGKDEPVSAFKFLSAKKEVYRPRLGLERMIYSEMVGRDKELNRLQLQVIKVINGEGSVVNLIGEAGIGKSRLMAELQNRDVMKRVNILEGRAISIGQNFSFHPIIDLLRHWARINEDDSKAEAFNKLETAVRRVHPKEADEIVPFVGILMGMKLSGRYADRVEGIEGEGLEKLILKNVRDLLIKATELTPLVIYIEDLHWADTSSIVFLESLFRLVTSHRINFVNVFRPRYKDTADRIVKFLKDNLPDHYIEIELQPLDENMSEAIINNIFNITGINRTVIDQIIDRSDGNPFFIEEVVRSFIDEGALVRKADKFEVTDKIASMIIPNSINDVLMARIDRLDENSRDLIKVASVIGRNFFYRILSEVAQMIDDLDGRLSYLKEIQLIRDRMRMKEIEYLFKHALAQEAAYNSILHKKRKELHLQVARSIEKVFIEKLHEFYGMLALHYIKGEDYEKAEYYLVKAGEEALRSSASIEALNYYQNGLRLYIQSKKENADPERLAMFEKNIAIAFYNKSRWVDAVQHIDKVFDYWNLDIFPNRITIFIKFTINVFFIMTGMNRLLEKKKPPPSKRDTEICDFLFKQSGALTYYDNYRFVINVLISFNKAIKIDITKTPEAINLLLGTAGAIAYGGFSSKVAYKLLDYSKAKMDKNNIQNRIVYEFMNTVTNLSFGNWEGFSDVDEELFDEALKKGDLWNSTGYLLFFSYVKVQKGDFLDIEHVIEKLSEIAVNYDYNLAVLYAGMLEIDMLLLKGKFSEALLEAERCFKFSIRHSTELHQQQFLSLKAEALIRFNDLEKAKALLHRAKKIIDQHKLLPPMYLNNFLVSKFMLDIYLLKKAKISKDAYNFHNIKKKSYKSGRKALRNAKKFAQYKVKILRLMGVYYWMIGSQKKGIKWWEKSIREGQNLGARPDLSFTYFEVGKRLLEPESKYKELNGITAEKYLEMARSQFQEMGLERNIDELDRLSAYSQI